MKSFKQFILEVLSLQDNKLKFAYSEKGEGVSSQLGKTVGKKKFLPYESVTKSGLPVYSVHRGGGSNYDAILKAIKGKNDVEVDPDQKKQFINRTANYLSHRIVKQHNIGHLLLPKSSSDILHHVAEELQRRHPHVMVHHDAFEKDVQATHVPDDSRISETTRKNLSSFVEKGKRAGNIELKKMAPQYRKFIHVPFKTNISKQHLKGENVAILDDVYTTGQSVSAMHNAIANHGANKVIGMSLFKG